MKTKLPREHFMRRVGEMKSPEARFICAWAFCRGTLSESVEKEALPFCRHQDEWDENENETSTRAFYETGG